MADAVVRPKKPATKKHTPAGGAPTAAHTADEAHEPRIDTALVTESLLGTWADTRREARELIKDPVFHKIEGMPMAEHRERALSQLHLLAQHGGSQRAFPAEYGGLDDNGANLAGFEELVLADPSMQIKGGVQWGLFGSAIYQLGTKKHWDRWLAGMIDMSLPGAFAMTEIGHGSDVAAIGTTATYDPGAEEFVIHTPFRAATKEYLGNAALHGRAATVFAQLITGGVNYGVHCFFVPIRDDEGAMLPGITSEDDGVKGGLNGIDNG
ncbi:MAG TPA: acyl-CoA dehydrogenase family protein, partial [Microbacterium sp.]|nr:acyl-CoA dehydrogenase family protein [Microbacterium sp.]